MLTGAAASFTGATVGAGAAVFLGFGGATGWPNRSCMGEGGGGDLGFHSRLSMLVQVLCVGFQEPGGHGVEADIGAAEWTVTVL